MSKKACKFKTGRPGFGCKGGKLYRFEKKSVLVLAPWPEPQAWFKSHRKGWHSSRKRADKVFSAALYAKSDIDPGDLGLDKENETGLNVWEGDPVKYEKWRRAVQYVRHLQAPYFDEIPEEVRNELLRYGSRKWHLFCLFARCPGSLDLSRSNPALCYALASNWVFHKPAVRLPLRAARSLIAKQQKHILAWLGFPGTETARRIMAKVEPRVLSIKFMLQFRCVFENAELVKWLSHLERINPNVAEMVTRRQYLPFLTSRLLRDASREIPNGQRFQSAVWMLDDTLRMLGRLPGAFCPPRFTSLRQLVGVHDELARLHERQWQRDQALRERTGESPSKFPDPPFAGTEAIQPILTPDDLHAEGQEMGHCVGIYDERVAMGRCFIYRVNAPVRATMEILSRDGRGWVPGQLSQARNKPVPAKIAIQLFHELFSSGKYVPEEEVEMMDADWTPEQAEDDRQLRLFNLDPQGDLAPL